MEKIGIIILNYNTFEDTTKCVDSIKQHNSLNVAIYIVDNASPDDSGRLLAKHYHDEKNIKVILSKTNLGFSGGNNLGIKKAIEDNADILFLLNSDIVVRNDAFLYMAQLIESDSNIAIVGPKIVNREEKYTQFARKGISLSAYLLDKKLFDKLFYKAVHRLRFYDYDSSEDFCFDGMVSGCCFGITAAFVKENDCLDDKVFMYYEEDILAYKLRSVGKLAAISSKAEVLHNEGISTAKSSENKMLFTRFHRWTSSLYVLKQYAKASGIVCKMISMMNVMIWRVLSLKSFAYKESLSLFIDANKRVLR